MLLYGSLTNYLESGGRTRDIARNFIEQYISNNNKLKLYKRGKYWYLKLNNLTIKDKDWFTLIWVMNYTIKKFYSNPP